MKRTLIFSVLLLLGTGLFAQNNLNSKSNQSFRNAQVAYSNKEYGKALKLAEDAIVYKKEQLKSDYETIAQSIAAREVKKAGDNSPNIIINNSAIFYFFQKSFFILIKSTIQIIYGFYLKA